VTFVKPIIFTEAVKRLGSRTPIAKALTSKEWADVPTALRNRAFFSANVEDARFLAEMQGFLDDFLTGAREEVTTPSGEKTTALKVGSRAQFVKLAREAAIRAGVPVPDEWRGGMRDITSSARLNLIFDVQTQSAQAYGDWKQGMQEDVLNAFPASRFIRVVDVSKPRSLHIQNTGVVRMKTDLGFWLAMNSPTLGGFGVPHGPWGYNSGMGVEDVSRKDAEALGLVKPGERLKSAEQGFAEHLKASVTNLDPQLQEFLKQKLGDSVKFQDGAAWWKGNMASKREAGIEPKPRKPVDPLAFPESLDQVETVKKLGGSTGAELVKHKKTGTLFVRKSGNSADHIREEFEADEIYRKLGVNVPEARLFNADGPAPVKLARYIEGKTLGTLPAKEQKAVIAALREDFAADAWLGNWDVGGTGLDNVLVDKDGKAWRIDNGGSLRFRAQGAKKEAAEWNEWPSDVWTMRDSAKYPVPGKLFGGMSIYDVSRSAAKLEAKVADALASAPVELRATLASRWNQIKAIADKAAEYERTKFTAPYADEVTRWAMELRKSKVFERLSVELKQAKEGDYVLKDENGIPFDHLRTQKGAKVADESQNFFDIISQAAKTVNAHHAKGDTSYNAGKLSNAAALKAPLEKIVATGSDNQKAMAGHYLAALTEIEKAKGDLKASVPFVTKHTMPAEGLKSGRSVISEFAEWMGANGGDWSIVSSWASGQAGSSGSAESKALKRFLMEHLEGATASDFYRAPGPAELAARRKAHGDKYDRTMLQFQAFVQEVLGRLEFPANDRLAKSVRLLRTETSSTAVPFAVGTTGDYVRGVNESGSIFAPVFSGTRTVTVVPHTRITSLYFFERTPGSGGDFLLGDSENEATYIAWGLKVLNLGKDPKNTAIKIGKTRKDWEL
jgi:hypothetical protein